MPRGNINNLVPNSELTPEERKERASKMGKASVEAKKKKKLIKEYLEMLLERETVTESGTVTGAEAMAISAYKGALKGEWKAWELVRDTVGEKPIEKVMVSEVDQEIVEEIERLVLED